MKHGLSIGVQHEHGTSVLHVRAVGKLTREDYEEVRPSLDTALTQLDDNPVLVLVDATELEGWERGAAWEDLKLGLNHRHDFERIAVVADKEWLQEASRFSGWFISGEVKGFGDRHSALDWLVSRDLGDEAGPLRISLDPEKGVLTLEPVGRLTKEDFDEVAAVIDPYIEAAGKLQGVVIMTREFPGWESFGALLSHLKFIRDHHKKVARVALVTDAVIGKLFESIGSHFISAEAAQFPFDDSAEAQRWLVSR